MLRSIRPFVPLSIGLLWFSTASALAEVTVRIADVTTLKGQSINHLTGMGLVVGLNGTGDGDQYEVTMRALAGMLGKLAAPVTSMDELKDTANVAIVHIDAVIPDVGAREGDRIEVRVSAIGSAQSLAGGRLLVTPLMYQDTRVETVYALAGGGVHIPDVTVPTAGVVDNGAVIQEDVLIAFTATGAQLPFNNAWIQAGDTYLTLVLDEAHAGWGMAVATVEAINAELGSAAQAERVALAVDPKNVIVWVPPFQRSDPAVWIRDVEELSVLVPPQEARITIDRTSGTIVVSGQARISPVIVSQKGLTVTVRVPPADAAEPRVETRRFVALDTDRNAGANVSDLLQALNQLQVPVEDRIAVLTEIQRSGKLHAKLMFKE